MSKRTKLMINVCGVHFTTKDIQILKKLVGAKTIRQSLMDAIEIQALMEQLNLEHALRQKE